MSVNNFLERRKEALEKQISEAKEGYKLIRVLAKSGEDITEREESLRTSIENLEVMLAAINEELEG